MKIVEPQVIHRMYDGVIEGEEVRFYEKRFAQIKGAYENPEGVPEDTLMYQVYSYEKVDAMVPGELLWGLTILEPVLVNGECNMTRGHFHQDRNCAEYYFGLGGEGLLLLMDEDGQCHGEKVFQGSLHHISGKLAHRLVNTGDVPLKVGACWPPCAGHDYQAIERQEFPVRIVKEDGTVQAKERN